MKFVETLKQPSNSKRIEDTVNYYICKIHKDVRFSAKCAAGYNKNNVSGYYKGNGSFENYKDPDDLGDTLRDYLPFDFKHVYMDVEHHNFISMDDIFLTKQDIESKVIKKLMPLLIEDGFKVATLRCEPVSMYREEIQYHTWRKDTYKKIYTGETCLYIYSDFSW